MDRTMILALLAGLVALTLLVLLFGVVLYLRQRARSNRIKEAADRRRARSTRIIGTEDGVNEGVIRMMRQATSGINIMRARQIDEVKSALISAGYKSRDAIVVYSFFKLVCPLILLAGAALYIYGLDPIGMGWLFDLSAVMAAGLIGSKLPDIVLNRAKTQRVEDVRKTLPDALDMLVICADAGLSSDASLRRVVSEMRRSRSAIADELEQTALEMSMQPERRVAIENFAKRVPLPSVTAFANAMIQAERYGTPLARAFRALAQDQRTERMTAAEQKAGRLPAIMTVPMMVFILPALFVVLIGPAVLSLMDNFTGG